MNTPRLIVTHGGMAHRDEFLAICVVFAWFDTVIPVERRDPTQEELADPDVWVIDVGHKYEPGLSNFDHHQMSPDPTAPVCALSLILAHFNLNRQWGQVYGWVEMTERLDTLGPMHVANWLSISVADFFRTLSPVEKAMLQIFEDDTALRIIPDSMIPAMSHVMQAIGTQLKEFVEAYFERLQWLRQHAAIQKVPNAEYHFIWIPRDDESLVLNDPSLAMRQYREESGADIPVSVTPDPRGPGYGLFRFDDDPRVDFTRLEDHVHADFVHKGGFYATTPAINPLVLEELVAVGCGIDPTLMDASPKVMDTSPTRMDTSPAVMDTSPKTL